MLNRLEFEEFSELARNFSKIGIFQEISGDTLTPIQALIALKQSEEQITLLESNPKNTLNSRYSYLFINPIVSISAYKNKVTISEKGSVSSRIVDPFTVLREFHVKYRTAVRHAQAKFLGGLVGVCSYDAVRYKEIFSDRHEADAEIPDLLFRIYQILIAFDHQSGKIVISTLTEVSEDLEKNYEDSCQVIESVKKQLFQSELSEPRQLNSGKPATPTVIADISDSEYCQMVEKAKSYIQQGDIFQAVLSRRFQMPVKCSAIEIYRALRFTNPAPYMFYLEAPAFVIAGTSPEKLVSLNNGILESCPLAGTRALGKAGENKKIEAELRDNEKENAEHMMLVDLTRHDLGSVAVPGSVKVTKLQEIEHFSRVMHIASTIQASLQPGKDVFDVIQSALPAGTLSGAPKIRAMDIIDELENSRRGIYGGAVCAIDGDGNLISCIAIRMAVIKDQIATVQAGGGIVFDSDPQAEADETRHKSRAILEGIALAEGEFAC